MLFTLSWARGPLDFPWYSLPAENKSADIYIYIYIQVIKKINARCREKWRK